MITFSWIESVLAKNRLFKNIVIDGKVCVNIDPIFKSVGISALGPSQEAYYVEYVDNSGLSWGPFLEKSLNSFLSHLKNHSLYIEGIDLNNFSFDVDTSKNPLTPLKLSVSLNCDDLKSDTGYYGVVQENRRYILDQIRSSVYTDGLKGGESL